MPDLEPDDALDAPSKSALKREMHRLQALGESLTMLSEPALDKLSIEDEALLSAIRECRQIRSNSARKRHLQYIGKLMRAIDPEPIEEALRAMHGKHEKQVNQFHTLEQLRDDVLEQGISGVELALSQFPSADRQHLRQLVMQHQREITRQKPPAASRKLFRYLKALAEDQD